MADLERGRPRKSRHNNTTPSEFSWTSWLVPLIVVANVAVFIATMFINNCPKHSSGLQAQCVAQFLGRLSFQPLKQNPLFGPSSETLEKMGGLQWYKAVHGNEAWRLFSCVWLHAGVVHVLANMLSLVFIGIRLEQLFGFGSSSSSSSSVFGAIFV